MHINKHRPECIVYWDWREQLDASILLHAIKHVASFGYDILKDEIDIIEIESGTDEHHLLVAPKGFTKEIGEAMLERLDVYFPDKPD